MFQELANYGEYSGAPSEQMTYNYAKTILGLMTQVKDDKGKVWFAFFFAALDDDARVFVKAPEATVPRKPAH